MYSRDPKKGKRMPTSLYNCQTPSLSQRLRVIAVVYSETYSNRKVSQIRGFEIKSCFTKFLDDCSDIILLCLISEQSSEDGLT